jgi:hypothetical protein
MTYLSNGIIFVIIFNANRFIDFIVANSQIILN